MHHIFDDREVWLISDGLFEPSADALTHADGAEALAEARRALGRNTLRMNINLMLMKQGSSLALIDAGLGEAWQGRFGRARSFLEAQGIRPADIGRIYLTHIHSDHSLGLFGPDGPYFPAATVFAPEGDMAYYTDAATRAATPEAKREPFEIAARLLETYPARVERIGPGAIDAALQAIALPGHSPGHMGYLVGRKLLTVGDLIHVPELQIADPRLGVRYDHDPVRAIATRTELLARAEREDWLLTGAHMDGINRLVREDDRLGLRAA